MIVKEKDAIYLDRPDGSRIYINGPWKDKQVWVDEKGLLYEKIPNNGRRYLKGPSANLNSFVDVSGRWYSITNANRIVYFDGDDKKWEKKMMEFELYLWSFEPFAFINYELRMIDKWDLNENN